MKNINIPATEDLPTVRKLVKSTLSAILVAAFILVAAVLPAEYGVDPTGIGRLIGLKRMGEIKVSLAQESEDDTQLEQEQMPENGEPQLTSPSELVSKANPLGSPSDEMTITLKPNEGKEIKLSMEKGAQVNYVWWTDGSKANFDAHADSKELNIKYHNYEKGAKPRSEGVLEAAFDGQHGWFWRNRTAGNMTVTLKVNGQYTDIGLVN